MRLHISIHFSLGLLAAGLAAGAGAQTSPPTCTLPPPMVCPPPPPPGMGPRLIDSMKAYVEGLDKSVKSMDQANENGWSPAAKAEIDVYEGELKHHRDMVADYVDKISPESGLAAPQQDIVSGGPE